MVVSQVELGYAAEEFAFENGAEDVLDTGKSGRLPLGIPKVNVSVVEADSVKLGANEVILGNGVDKDDVL